MVEVSIIIVTYNSASYIGRCLKSIYQNTQKNSFEIIVVDNHSSDDTAEIVAAEFPGVQLIVNERNLGFGAGNNVGAEVAKGEFLFFLNPDTEVVGDVIYELSVISCQLSGKRILGCELVNEVGEATFSFGCFPSVWGAFFELGLRRIFPGYYERHLSTALTARQMHGETVDYVCGAALYLDKGLFDHLGGFDERFFMYWEEVDLAKRSSVMGIRCSVVGEAKIVHYEGKSFREEPGFNYEKYEMMERSKYYYFRKHHGVWAVFVLKVIQFFRIVIDSLTSKQGFWRSFQISFLSTNYTN